MGNYLKRLQLSSDDRKKASATTEEAKAKAAVQIKIAELTAKSVTLNAAKEEALGAVPFNVDRILSLQKEASENEANLAAINAILTSEFTDAAA